VHLTRCTPPRVKELTFVNPVIKPSDFIKIVHIEYWSRVGYDTASTGTHSRTTCLRHRFMRSLDYCVRYSVCLFVWGATALSGPGPPHSRGFYIKHNDAPQSVGLLRTSDKLVAETSTWKHTKLMTDTHAPGGIRTHSFNRRAATDLRLRARCHWNGLRYSVV
jgi:hypothetical protein